MLWKGTWLLVVMLKLVLARREDIYSWSSEEESIESSSDGLNRSTANWKNKPYLKRAPSHRESDFIRSLCSLEDPTRLYEVQDQIGSGAFGKVYKGRRRSDGKQVAIKTIAMDHHPDMLVRELRAMNIVKQAQGRPRSLPVMYAAYKDVTDSKAKLLSNEPHRRRLWIVMEFITGVTITGSMKSSGLFRDSPSEENNGASHEHHLLPPQRASATPRGPDPAECHAEQQE